MADNANTTAALLGVTDETAQAWLTALINENPGLDAFIAGIGPPPPGCAAGDATVPQP